MHGERYISIEAVLVNDTAVYMFRTCKFIRKSIIHTYHSKLVIRKLTIVLFACGRSTIIGYKTTNYELDYIIRHPPVSF